MKEVFRGTVEFHAMASFWPFSAAKLSVDSDVLHLKRLMGKNIEISKGALSDINVHKIRSPFAWRTALHLQFAHENHLRKVIFIPFSGGKVAASLKKFRWL